MNVRRLASCGLALLLVLGCALPVRAQQGGGGGSSASSGASAASSASGGGGATNPPTSSGEESGPEIRDSTVGYIDPAIPGNVVRLRATAAFDDIAPGRGEFFYSQSPPQGHGPPLDEPRANYEDVALYLERAFTERFSVFAEIPYRWIQFQVNGEPEGLSDSNLGFKYAFVRTEDTIGTFQLRTYIPTGAASQGLTTGHATLEPAFLFYQKLLPKLATEGEFRYWLPLGGTPGFRSEVIRYGLGLRYTLLEGDGWSFSPVTEVVGWTFLSGLADKFVSGGEAVSIPAAGETIVNVKNGFRVRFDDWGDFYAGYGRSLTGTVLYKDIVSVEFRVFY